MTIEAQEATPQAKPDEKPEAKPKDYHVNETKTGQRDPFTAAFNEAQDELRGEEDKPAQKPKKKPEPKPEPKKEAKAEESADEGDEDASEEAAQAEPEKPVKREPKKWWSSRKRDAFANMPKHIQDEWLAEAPQPLQNWSEEHKAAFAKIPVEGQELLLERHQDLERGFTEKFMQSAGERKFAEEMRAAVPPEMRAYMQQRGLTEQQVFSKLLGYQRHAMTDPLGYVRDFIANNNINPLDIIPMDSDGKPNTQAQRQPADIRSHPAYQALAAEHQALQQSVANERQQREEQRGQQAMAEFQGLLSETDGEGNSLYPFIRLLAEPMTRIITSDPERFGSLGVKDRLAVAYNLALEDFPELSAIRLTAPKPKADEPKAITAASDDAERVSKLERAITPKSRTPVAPSGKTGPVTLEDAIAFASKKIGQR